MDIRLLKLICSKHIGVNLMDRRHFACEIDMNFEGRRGKTLWTFTSGTPQSALFHSATILGEEHEVLPE